MAEINSTRSPYKCKRATVRCEICQKEYPVLPALAGTKTVCSRACRVIKNDRQRPKKTCPECGAIFNCRHGQMYCSRLCASKNRKRGDKQTCGVRSHVDENGKLFAEQQPMPTNPKFENLEGRKFERLTVKYYVGKSGFSDNNPGGKHCMWYCECTCGTFTVLSSDTLKGGTVISCGCYKSGLEPDGQSRACTKCKSILPLTEEYFYRNSYYARSFYSMCKQCTSGIVRRRSKNGRDRDRIAVMMHYSGGNPRCECCGTKHQEFLAIDHIEGGGRQHRKLVGNVYRFLIKNGFPEGYRVLCHSCNQSRGLYGYCPCEKMRELAPDYII